MPFVTIQDGDAECRASFATSRRREDSPSRSLGGGDGLEKEEERAGRSRVCGRRRAAATAMQVATVMKILGDSYLKK